MFDVDEFIQESIESLQNTIDDIVIIACSGGVDSTVAAVIANKAVGDLLLSLIHISEPTRPY